MSTLSLEISEEKRKTKDQTLNRVRDDLAAAKSKVGALEDELDKQKQKSSREYSRLKAEYDNFKSETSILERSHKENEFKVQNQLLQANNALATEQSRIAELEKALASERARRQNDIQFVSNIPWMLLSHVVRETIFD